MPTKEEIEDFRLGEMLEAEQWIELNILDGRTKGEYTTQIKALKDEGYLLVVTPSSGGKIINVSLGTRARIRTREEGGLYVIPAEVVDTNKEGVPFLAFEVAEKIIRVQERKHFRLELGQKTEFRVVANTRTQFKRITGIEKIARGKEKVTIENDRGLSELDTLGTIEDISAGGMRFSTKKAIKAGQIIEISFDFMETSFRSLFGEVVRVIKKADENIEKYELGVRFITISERDQDQLIGWLFEKQCEWREKGLL